MDFAIVVGGLASAGVHSGSYDGSGTTATAMAITVCLKSQTVNVQAVNRGAERYGVYEGINVSAFSGILLVAL